MSSRSVRLKITLAFTGAMALVLAAFGTYIFLQTRAQLDESVSDNLEVRVADLATSLPGTRDGSGLALQALDPEDSFSQVVGPDGELEFTTDQVGAAPVATEEGGFDLDELDGIDGRVRVLATELENGRLAVAGASLEDRDEGVENLLLLLVIGGPVALFLASLAGYWVAGRALAPLERGYERERRFVDDASHELRTPLALHKAELETALRYGEGETDLRAAISSGVEEVDRLSQLADDLLVVARSGDDGLAVTTEDVNAAELLETIATRFDARVRAAGRSLLIESDSGLVLRADRLRIEQALTNLAENAIRHGDGQILLSAHRSTGGVKLGVRDAGAGFDDAFRKHAFERFSRGDAARGRGGAGLGLSIVQAIAEAHGGRAGIDDGPGASVWIELPGGG